MDRIKKFLTHRATLETLRYLVFGAISMLALIPMWDASQVVFYFIGVVSLVGLFSHISRRMFFPYVDMRAYAKKALDEPISAAIVFLAVTILLCVMLHSVTQLVGFK